MVDFCGKYIFRGNEQRGTRTSERYDGPETKQFSFPGGSLSSCTETSSGSINEGGEFDHWHILLRYFDNLTWLQHVSPETQSPRLDRPLAAQQIQPENRMRVSRSCIRTERSVTDHLKTKPRRIERRRCGWKPYFVRA